MFFVKAAKSAARDGQERASKKAIADRRGADSGERRGKANVSIKPEHIFDYWIQLSQFWGGNLFFLLSGAVLESFVFAAE